MIMTNIDELLPIIFVSFSGALKPALLLAIVVSCLNKNEKYELSFSAYYDSTISIIVCVFLSSLFHFSNSDLIVTVVQYLSGAASLTVAIVLTYLNWSILGHRRILGKTTAAEIIGITSLTFPAVFEKYETVSFLTTSFIMNPFVVANGAAIGSILVLGVAGLLTRGISQFNDKRFFRCASLFLTLFAAASLCDAAHEFIMASQTFGLELGLLDKTMFDINPLLNENGSVGSILRATFGYDGNPEMLILVTYATYWLVAIAYILRKKQERYQKSLVDVSGQVTNSNKIGDNLLSNIVSEIEKSSLQRKMKRLETVVEDQAMKLKEAERFATIGQTARMVGHDLRNPLQTIDTILHIANKKIGSLPPSLGERNSLKELLSSLEEQVVYMDKIVSDLQDYSRPLKPEFIEISVEQIINVTISTVRIPENVVLETSFGDAMPRIWLDPKMIQRMLTNLFINAIQAMSNGGKLTVKAYKAESSLNIEIQDTGVGILQENLPKLFNPLFTTKAKGQGLGLAVCKRVVEAHGGIISVRSDVEKGSTFTISIPLRKETNVVITNV